LKLLQTLGQFVVGNSLLSEEDEDKRDGRHNDRQDEHHGGHDAFRADGQALLFTGASTASSANLDARGGQPSLLQPPQQTEIPAATPVNKEQPIQHAEARHRLAARTLDPRVLDQALAGLDDSMFAVRLHRDDVFAWAR
jgi:hypothetical protein